MDQSEMLFDHFLENARVAPDTTFAIFSKGGQDKVISRGDVLCQATALMKILRANGVPRGSIIPIVLNHSEWLYSAFIGCVIGGYVPSILPPWNIKQDVALFQGNCSPGVRLTLRRPPVQHPAIPSAALQISFDTVTGYSILTTG